MTMTTCTAKTDNPHYVTPEEADKKYCVKNLEFYCFGPQCMAWRWKPTHRQAEWPTTQTVTEYSTTHGYCGMVRS